MNNEIDDQEWNDKFGGFLTELPQEATPSPLLEERTVRALRQHGLLRRKRRLPAAWLYGSVAASLALFAFGVAVGQYLGTRNTLSIVQRTDQAAAAAHVQQTGTAYVQALEALVTVAQQNRTQDATQAREVALTALHEAANEIVRLAPNDPVVAKILQGIEQERRQNQLRSGRPNDRQIVWF